MEYPINVIDAGFFLSNIGAAQPNLPNTINIVFNSKKIIQRERLIESLRSVNKNFPGLRLGTQFDIKKFAWTSIDEKLLEEYFRKLVTLEKFDKKLDEILATGIKSIDYKYPFKFNISGKTIHFKMSHLLGDGMYAVKLLNVIFCEYFRVNTKFKIAGDLKSLLNNTDYAPLDFKFNLADIKPNLGKPDVKKYATSQKIFIKIVDEKNLEPLRNLVNKKSKENASEVSINTLLNILLIYQLHKVEININKSLLRVVASLSRYYQNDLIFPYNFLYLFDVIIKSPDSVVDIIEQSIYANREIAKVLNDQRAIFAEIKSENTKFHKNKTKYIESSIKDYNDNFQCSKRTFVLPNLGKLESYAPFLLKNIVFGDMYIAAPIIGSNAINIITSRLNGKIVMCASYDRMRIKKKEIQEIFSIFDKKHLLCLHL